MPSIVLPISLQRGKVFNGLFKVLTIGRNSMKDFENWLSDNSQCRSAYNWIRERNERLKSNLCLPKEIVKETVQRVKSLDNRENSLAFLVLYFKQTDEDYYDQRFVVECLLKLLKLKPENFYQKSLFNEEEVKNLIDEIFKPAKTEVFVELMKCLIVLVSKDNIHFAAEIAVRFLKSRKTVSSLRELPGWNTNFLGKLLGFLSVYEVNYEIDDRYREIIKQLMSEVPDLEPAVKTAMEFLRTFKSQTGYKARLIVLETYLTYQKNTPEQYQVDGWLKDLYYDEEGNYNLSVVKDEEKYIKICVAIVESYRKRYGIEIATQATSWLQEVSEKYLPSFAQSFFHRIETHVISKASPIENFEAAISEFLPEKPIGIILTVDRWEQLIGKENIPSPLTLALQQFWQQQTIDGRINKAIDILTLDSRMVGNYRQINSLKNSCLNFLSIVLGKSIENINEKYLEQLRLRCSVGLNYLPNDGLFGKRLMRYLEYMCFTAINSGTNVERLDSQIIMTLDTIQENLKILYNKHSNFNIASFEYIMACVAENKIDGKTAKFLLNDIRKFLALDGESGFLDAAIKSKKITKNDYYRILIIAINHAFDNRELLAIEPERLCKEVLFKFLSQLTLKKEFVVTEFNVGNLVQLNRFFNTDFIVHDDGTRDAIARRNQLSKTREILQLLFSQGSIEISSIDSDKLQQELGNLSKDNDFTRNEYYTDLERMNNTLFVDKQGKIVFFEEQEGYLALKFLDTRQKGIVAPELLLASLSMWGELILGMRGESVQLPFRFAVVSGLIKVLDVYDEQYFKLTIADIARILSFRRLDFSGCTFNQEFNYVNVGKLSNAFFSFYKEVNKFRNLIIVLTENIIDPQEKTKHLNQASLDKLDGLTDLMKVNLGNLNKKTLVICLERLNREINQPWIKVVSKSCLLRHVLKYAIENLDKTDFVENYSGLVKKEDSSKEKVNSKEEDNLLEIIKTEFESCLDALDEIYNKNLSVTMLLQRDPANFSIEYFESLYKQYQQLANNENWLPEITEKLLKSVKYERSPYKGTQIFLEKLVSDTLLEMQTCLNSLKAFLREDHVTYAYQIPNGVSNIITADIGSNNKNQEKVAKLIRDTLRFLKSKGANPAFLDLLGDIFYPFGPGAAESKYYDERFYKYFRECMLFLFCGPVGNHEYGFSSERKLRELAPVILDLYNLNIKGEDRVWLLILHGLSKVRHPGIDPRIVWAGNEISAELLEYMKEHFWRFNLPNFYWATWNDVELNLCMNGNDLVRQIIIYHILMKKEENILPEDNQAAFIKHLLEDPKHQGKLNILKIHQPLYPHGARFTKPDTKYYTNEEELLELKANIAQLINDFKDKLKENKYNDIQKTKFIREIIDLQYYYNHISGDATKDDHGLVMRAALKTIRLKDGTSAYDKIKVIESGHEHIFNFIFNPLEAPIEELLAIKEKLIEELKEGFVELAELVRNLSDELLFAQKPIIQVIIGTGGGSIQEQKLFDEFSTCILEHGIMHRWVDEEKVYHAHFYAVNGGEWYFNSVQGLVFNESIKPNGMVDEKAERLKHCVMRACRSYFALIRTESEKNSKFLNTNVHHGQGGTSRANNLINYLSRYNANLNFTKILDKLDRVGEEYDSSQTAPEKHSLLAYVLGEIEKEFKEFKKHFRYRESNGLILIRYKSVIDILRDQIAPELEELESTVRQLLVFQNSEEDQEFGDEIELIPIHHSKSFST